MKYLIKEYNDFKTNYMYIDKEGQVFMLKDLLIKTPHTLLLFYYHYLAGSNYHTSPCSRILLVLPIKN